MVNEYFDIFCYYQDAKGPDDLVDWEIKSCIHGPWEHQYTPSSMANGHTNKTSIIHNIYIYVLCGQEVCINIIRPVCMYVCTYVRMYVRTYVGMYVYIYVNMYIYMYAYIYMHIYILKYVYIQWKRSREFWRQRVITWWWKNFHDSTLTRKTYRTAILQNSLNPSLQH